MQPNRRYYETQVLVVPIGDDASTVVDDITNEGPDGVILLTDVEAAPEATARADAIVFVVASLDSYTTDLVDTVAGRAREAGNLVAALTVGIADPVSAPERAAMGHLRDRVDVLVSVRTPPLRAHSSTSSAVGGAMRPAPDQLGCPVESHERPAGRDP